MKDILVLLTLIIYFQSCTKTIYKSEQQEERTLAPKINNSVFVVLPYDTTQTWIFNSGKQTQLTTNDFQLIEKLLTNCIKDYNPFQEKLFKDISNKHPEHKLNKNDYIIDLKRYKRQYIAVTNEKGEKEVWINCFCLPWEKSLKHNVLVVDDGGNCFFHLKINLTTGIYYNFSVNGYA
jgi:hypothetical protein